MSVSQFPKANPDIWWAADVEALLAAGWEPTRLDGLNNASRAEFVASKRARAAGYMRLLPTVAYQQGAGHTWADRPIRMSVGNVPVTLTPELFATRATTFGARICALVQEVGSRSAIRRPEELAVRTRLVVADGEELEDLRRGQTLAVARNGELYLSNLLTPNRKQLEHVEDLITGISSVLNLGEHIHQALDNESQRS